MHRGLSSHTGAADARGRGSTERTVANQLQSIYRKLGIQSRNELPCVLREQSLGSF